MQQAAHHLVGTHDFSSFRGGPVDNRPPVRTVTDIFVTDFGDEIVVDVFGQGFLRKMVRIIVGTLAEVGVGMRHPDSMPTVLAYRNRRAAGITAPARGLTLMTVETEEDWFARAPRRLRRHRARPDDAPRVRGLALACRRPVTLCSKIRIGLQRFVTVGAPAPQSSSQPIQNVFYIGSGTRSRAGVDDAAIHHPLPGASSSEPLPALSAGNR